LQTRNILQQDVDFVVHNVLKLTYDHLVLITKKCWGSALGPPEGEGQEGEEGNEGERREGGEEGARMERREGKEGERRGGKAGGEGDGPCLMNFWRRHFMCNTSMTKNLLTGLKQDGGDRHLGFLNKML
jgi:hypothetical protein